MSVLKEGTCVDGHTFVLLVDESVVCVILNCDGPETHVLRAVARDVVRAVMEAHVTGGQPVMLRTRLPLVVEER